MAFRLPLTAKGLLLVAIPLCFEIGFVWEMTRLQAEAEQETKQALKAEDLSNRFNHIALHIYKLWDVLDRTREPNVQRSVQNLGRVYLTQFQPLINQLREEYAAVDALTKDNPNMNELVTRSSRSLDLASSALNNTYTAYHQGRMEDFLHNYLAYKEQIATVFERLASQDFLLAAQHQRDFAQTSSKRQAQLREQMVQFVLIACAVNAAFCLMLAIFFVGNITSRLKILSDNAQRVAVHKPLNQPLKGNDEIAEVDRVFHSMADSIDEASRMRQEFVNMLTHDLRSPLTAILGTLEILDAGRAGHLDEHGERLVKLADRNGERMMRLINDLLDVEKMSSGMLSLSIEDVCLDEILENVKASVDAWIEEHGMKLTIEDTGLFVKADGEKLERVIFNLVANAIKFSPNGGTIAICAKENSADVEVTVSDQGKGIAADQQETIFERFRQAHTGDGNQQGGSGLGLTICRSIITLLGGKIWVTSEIGKGSQFHFTLPKA